VSHLGFTDWDDPFYATDQPLIQDLSPAGLTTIFSTFVEGNYHPLTMTSLAVDYHFWKLDPRGWHLENLALHVLVTLLVFAFVFLLSGSQAMAGIAALFFGVHPMHVESVAWVSGRKDVLYALFYLGGCISYLLWARGRPRRPALYAVTLVLFVLSLLAKGMAVSFPLALLAIDFYLKRKPTQKTMLLEKAPFLAIALAFGMVALTAQARQGAVQDFGSFGLGERVLFACYGICSYVVRAIVPGRLSALYPYPLRGAGGALPLLYYLAPLGVGALVAGVYLSLRRGRDVAFGALFFLANLVMVLQLIPVGSAVIADRYTYLPYVGLGFILASLIRPWIEGTAASRPALRAAALALLALAAGGAIYATQARCAVWKDNLTLWNDVLAQYPNLPMGYTMRARTYMQEGRNDLAMADAQRAISLDPKQPRALTMRGTMRYMARDYAGALTDLEEAVRLEPKEAVPWNSLGAVHLTQGHPDVGIQDFTKAIDRKPDYAEAYLNRALAYCAVKQFDRAMPDFDTSIRLQPGNPKAWLWRGETRLLGQDVAGAIQDYSRSLDLDPGFAATWYARAKANARLGRKADAAQDFLRARQLGYPVRPDELASPR
jgi:tetratricopeptide (TPR) repeat protein